MMNKEINIQLADALQLHQAGELASAQQAYVEILKNQPENANAHHLLGMLYAQCNDYEQALIFLKKATQLEINNPLFHNNLANAFKNTGQFDAAKRHYQIAISLNPNYAEALNNFGSLLHKQNLLDVALEYYKKAIHIKPDHIIAHYNCGLVLIAKSNWPAAEKQFNNVLELAPEHCNAYLQKANIALQLAHYEQARTFYLKALSINPDNIEALNNLGAVYIKLDEPQQAVLQFTQVLALDNKNDDARSNIAATFMRFHRHENALVHYLEFLQHHPDDIEARYNTAVAYMSLGKLDDAIYHYEIVLKLNPNHIDALANMGAIYLRQQHKTKALNYFNAVLERDPDNEAVAYMHAALLGDNKFTEAPQEYIKNLFDNYALQFEEHLVKHLSYQVPQIIAGALQAYYGEYESLTVLDCGCGTGLMAEQLPPTLSQLVGIDLSANMLAVAKKKLRYNALIQASLNQSLPLHTSFNIMIAADVLGYMGDLSAMLQHTAEHLIAGGVYCFSCEISKVYPYECQTTARFAHHPDYIKQCLSECNLELISNTQHVARTQEEKPLKVMIYIAKKNNP